MKSPNTIRLLLQNVGGIDLKPEGSIKLASLHSFMQEAQVDVAALTECNVAWNLVEHDLYPPNKQNFGGKMRTGQSRTTGKRNTLPPICEAAHALLSPTNCRTGLSVQVMIRWA